MAGTSDSRVLATLSVLFIVSSFAYARLPPATVDRAFIAFFLPVAAVAIVALMRVVTVREPVYRGNQTPGHTYDAIVFRIVLFVGALHGLVLFGLLGHRPLDRVGQVVPRLVPFLLGIALMVIGNLLPRIRPNAAIGIRTTRTLSNRDAWLRVNRRAGYVAVALGIAIVLTALLVPPGTRVAAVVGVAGMVAAVALTAWTWRDAYGRHNPAR
jgi:uncharacterized membrane protein